MQSRLFCLVILAAASLGARAQDPRIRITKSGLGYRFSDGQEQIPKIDNEAKKWQFLNKDTLNVPVTASSNRFLAIWASGDNKKFSDDQIDSVVLLYGKKGVHTVPLTGARSGRSFVSIPLTVISGEVPSGGIVTTRIYYGNKRTSEYYFSYYNKQNQQAGETDCFNRDSVLRMVQRSCQKCCDDNLIVYDAKCKKLYWIFENRIKEINNLSQVRVYYNRATKFEVIRANRYQNTISLELDDVFNTSTTPALINAYLLGGGGEASNVIQGIGNQSQKSGKTGGGAPAHTAHTKAQGDLSDDGQAVVNNWLSGADQYTSMIFKSAVPLSADLQAKKGKTIQLDTGAVDPYYSAPVRLQDFDLKDNLMLLKVGDSVEAKRFKGVNAALLPFSQNSLVTRVDTFIHPISVNSFLADLFEFKKSYDSLIDDQIRAFSICSDTFPCCSPGRQKTFSDLDLQLFKLDTEYVALKKVIATSKKDDATPPDGKGDQQGNQGGKADQNNQKSTCCIVCMPCSGNGTDNSDKTKQKMGSTDDPNAQLDSLWVTFKKITQEQLVKLILFHNNLVEDNLSFVSAPIYPQGEGLNVSLTIATQDTAAKLGIPMQNDQTHFNLVVVHKPEFGFSSGTFYTWGKNISYTKYEYQQVPSGSSVIQSNSPYKLMASGTASAAIGADAMANISYKVCTAAALGLSGGVGVTIESKPRVAYLAAFTMAVGNIQQFYFTVGVSAVPVNTLKSDQNPNANVFYATNPGEIQYNTKLKSGCFFSLSYTIFKTKSTKYGSYTAAPKSASTAAGKGSNGMPSVSFQFNTAGSGGSNGSSSSGKSDPNSKNK